MKAKYFILDTSIFVNPAAAHYFGPTPTLAFARFLELSHGASGLEFLMPPSVYRELMHFAEESKISKKSLLRIHQKAPRKHEIRVPGIFVYTLVENMRDRIDRGLRLAERCVRDALAMEPPAKAAGSNPRGVRPDAQAVGALRESYRRIMREGLLDSAADVDLLLLAYETGGTLVSADQGLLDWAEELGIPFLSHEIFREFLAERTAS